MANVDRVYEMEWTVELFLRPKSTLLEERVTLSNRSDVMHRFYWWNNAASRVSDDSQIVYPMRFAASHGFTEVVRWPVDEDGHDLSIIRNHAHGAVSLFTHGTREDFMGVWHPSSRTGTVHFAKYEDLPAKKIWSWGVDEEGVDWRKASPTTTVDTLKSRPVCFAIRRRMLSRHPGSPFTSRSTGCPCGKLPVPDLSFTRDGLEPILRSARTNYQVGAAYASCGKPEDAAKKFQLASAASSPDQTLWAWRAAQRLPGFDRKQWRERLQSSLEQAKSRSETSSFSSWWNYTAGALAGALGNQKESDRAFKKRCCFLIGCWRTTSHAWHAPTLCLWCNDQHTSCS